MASKRDGSDIELGEAEGLVRTTIVGGQPRKKSTFRMTVTVGLERLLYFASLNTRFRAALAADRNTAMKAAGLKLSDGEASVLASIDADTLDTMITAVRPQSRPLRPFLRSVAATFVTLATGSAQVGCEMPVATGIGPDQDFGNDPGTTQDVGLLPDQDPVRGMSIDAEEDVWNPSDVLDLDVDAGPNFDVGSDPGVEFDAEFIPGDTGIKPDIPESLDIEIETDAPVVTGIGPDVPDASDDTAGQARAPASPELPRTGRA
jgi:hypothetical protein